MKRKSLTRKDFLKLAGLGAAITLPVALGLEAYDRAQGEYPVARSPYAEIAPNTLDGTVPILMLTNRESENPFGVYLGEIMRAEGLNCFHMADLSSIQANGLELYDLIVLAEGVLKASQVEMLANFVARGGRLVSMAPDARLGAILGVERSAGDLSEGYIKTNPDHTAGVGINLSTMQFHGKANLYRLAGAQPVAWLYHDRNAASGFPAITLNKFGEGFAALWAFDLAKSIALTRQGNPELIGQDNDGLAGVRTVDKFVGWIDLDRIAIPQADEHQRLFANVLTELSQDKRPLPRLWYFPGDKKSVLVTTGDSHMNPVNFIHDVLSRVEKRGGHMTVYYSPVIVSDIGRTERVIRFWVTDHVPLVGDILGESFGSPTPQDVSDWRAKGHEFALHPYVDYDLEDGWHMYWKEFTGRGYGPVPPTVRSHRVLWSGWTESARLQASYGMRMNLGYYHVGPSLQKKDGEWVYGHLTGSGRPMRFIDSQGRILNIYQQLTQLADEHLIPMDVPGWGGWPNLTPQQAVEVSKYMLDRSVKHGDYCALCGQFHIDPLQLGGEPAEKAGLFLEGTLDYAQSLGVPIWSAQEWLHFTEDRDGCNFTNMGWNTSASTLTFSLLPRNQAQSTLTVMLPTRHAGKSLTAVEIDGAQTPFTRLSVGGVDYASTQVDAQAHNLKAKYG